MVAVFGGAASGCGLFTTPGQAGANVVKDFLSTGYDIKTYQNYNLIRNAPSSAVKEIFADKFPDLAKNVWMENSRPEYILQKVKYFYVMHDLTNGARVRAEVDDKKVVMINSILSVPERAVTLYIDDVADTPSSTPNQVAYELHKPNDKWLINLYF